MALQTQFQSSFSCKLFVRSVTLIDLKFSASQKNKSTELTAKGREQKNLEEEL